MDKSISFRGSSGQWCSDWRLEASIFHDPIDGDHLFVSDRLTTKSTICSFEHIGLYERLRQSEQSRSLAWQVLQEIRQVLEVLGDQRIPYEGERKRFRAEGDFLVRALVDLISHCRAHLGRLEGEFADLERLVRERDLPREVLQAVRHLSRRQERIGLSETELRERLNRLQELHILPEHRVEPGVSSDGGNETG